MDDKTLIEDLGGSTVVARLLKLDKKNGVQRVNNWKVRGIPASVKLAHPEIFLKHFKPVRKRALAGGERRKVSDRRDSPRRISDKPR